MNTPSVYPSLLAIEHDPQSWARRIAELTVPITGIHYDIGDGLFVPTMMLDPVDISYIFLSKEQRAKSKDEDL